MSRKLFIIQNSEFKTHNWDEFLGALIVRYNVVEEKSYRFAVRIVNLFKFVRSEYKEFVMTSQLLRSGTSIGANIAESQRAQSRADFISKLSIAHKETYETKYWLRLLNETGYLNDNQAKSILSDGMEIERIFMFYTQ